MGQRYGSMALERRADNPDYGSERTPIKVGGGFGDGLANSYRFLNALRGPGGEPVRYSRMGSCCGFETANSPFGQGLLDIWDVTYDGGPTKRLYINFYDKGDVLVPDGFSATGVK
jgi:hypothetical protein